MYRTTSAVSIILLMYSLVISSWSCSRFHVVMSIINQTTAQIINTTVTSTLALCVNLMLYECLLFWYTSTSLIFSAKQVNIRCRCRYITLLER